MKKQVIEFLYMMECASAYVKSVKPKIQKPNDVFSIMYPIVKDFQQETFLALTLNARNTLIEINPSTIGIVDRLQIHARELFRKAIVDNASRIVLVHNHPSGDASPSPQDIECTKTLVSAGKIIGIEIIDHIVIGHKFKDTDTGFVSFREIGLI